MGPINRYEFERKIPITTGLMDDPTKHWVRINAWLPVATERFKKCNRKIRYFTLTTEALYDVKTLIEAGLLERSERGYPGLGFCEMYDYTYEGIMRKIRWCGWSYKGTFEEMVDKHPRLADEFNFDIVNLDFFGVPFPQREAPLEGTWGAIKRMIQVQKSHGTSFDLFITLKCRKAETDEQALKEIASLIKSNLDIGRGKSEFESRVGHLDIIRLLAEDYRTFLCVGVPKLIIGEAVDVGYALSYFESYCYPRVDVVGNYHIVKFVFSLEVPQQQKRVFAQPPWIVASYDEAVPMIFNKEMVNVSSVFEKNARLVFELQRDLDRLKTIEIGN